MRLWGKELIGKESGYLNTEFLKYPIDEKLLVLIPFAAALFTGISTIEGYFLNDLIFVFAGSVSTLIFVYTYFLTRAKKNIGLVAWIMILNTLLLANVVWLRFEGSHGAATVMFLTIIFCISTLFRNKSKPLAISVVLLNLFLLFYIEYNYPVLIKPYDSQIMRITDMFITFSVCGVFIIFIIQCLLKSYYQEKARSDQMDRLKNEFLANISHELRTPMNAIIGFTGLMGKSRTTVDEHKMYSKIVEDSCKRLIQMVEDIIEIAQIQSNEKKIQSIKCNLTDLLGQVYDCVENSSEKKDKKDVKLILEDFVHERKVFIETDPVLLKQVLLNLIDNALKFTTKGFIKFGYILQKSQVLFFVKDTGIGISEEDQNFIFDSFTKGQHDTNKLYNGVGLGLAISKKILQLLFGKIWVVSTVDQGSTFYFTLPNKSVEIIDQSRQSV